MKKSRINTFFAKSIFIHLFLTLMIVLVSWQFFEPYAYNFMVKNFTANKSGSDDIVVIVIDDKSIEKYRWPWQRSLYAKMFEYLNDYSNPKLIGFDAIISTPDKNNPQSDIEFFNTVKRIDKLVVGFSPLVQKGSGVDKIYEEKFKQKFAINIDDKRSYKPVAKYKSFSKYPQEYFDSVKNTGSVNTTPNASGYIISSDQLIDVNGNLYPSLALRMYLKLKNINNITLLPDKIIVGESKIPVTSSPDAVQSLTHYYKIIPETEYSHKKYSAIDVINSLDAIKQGKKPVISPDKFNNKIVFVGANAKAAALSLEDALPTPVLQKHPGVDIQATNFNCVYSNEFIRQTTFLQDVLILLVLTTITLILILNLSFFQSLGILILLSLCYTFLTALCFKNNIAPNVVTPLAVQLITMIFGYSYRFIEGRNKEKIKQAMGKYISQDIMQNVVQNIDDIKLGGKKATVTVLFADIRGFTKISEQISAEEVSVILNEYFTEIEPIIRKYNGVINKFIGDAVMAIFGEPIQDVNHPKNAVLCAAEMLKTVDKLRDKWLFEGKPKIEIGIGINTGEAFVGNIGSEKRMEYTVIGDMVNLASRIESYNKVYKNQDNKNSSTNKKSENKI